MKKIIQFSIFCCIASILFTSCKSNMTVMKRRYNNGYYISHNSGKQHINTAPEHKKATVPTIDNMSNSSLAPLKNEPALVEKTNDNTVTENNTIVASNEKKLTKTVLKKHAKQIQALQAKLVEKRVAQIKHVVSENKKLKNSSADADDALSLLWIIILAILILWLIGILAGGFGLGGLINLLLVVALVLLILWLLRIL